MSTSKRVVIDCAFRDCDAVFLSSHGTVADARDEAAAAGWVTQGGRQAYDMCPQCVAKHFGQTTTPPPDAD